MTWATTTKQRFLVFLGVIVIACVAIFAYMVHDLQTQGHEPNLGNGDLPFDERQTIEAYQADIDPIAVEALAALEDAGFGDPERLSESSVEGACGPDDVGFTVYGASVAGEPLHADAAQKALASVMKKTGFTENRPQRDDYGVSFRWTDDPNGGSVELLIMDGSHSVFSYDSSCRPTDGSTRTWRDYRPSAWELEIPMRSSAGESSPSSPSIDPSPSS